VGSRRALISAGAWIALGLPLARLRVSAAADSAPRVLIRPADPQAVELGYVENAARVETAKYPSWRLGQNCANCTLIGLGTGRMRPCSVLPGRLVLSTGWCRKWQARGT
jgi:hypothetical protein